MTTSSNPLPTPPLSSDGLRLTLLDSPAPGSPDGAWWPRSRDLQVEGADLVDHFPTTAGRIQRLLFSRPDWDDSMTASGGTRSIQAARGRIKMGSFPSDDTHLMVATMASGQRLKLLVIPSDTEHAEAERLLQGAGEIDATPGDGVDWDRWDDERP